MLQAGDKIPEFSLKDLEGETVSNETLLGQRSVLVFFPAAFSGVCSDQLSVYQEMQVEFEKHNAKVYGISVDVFHSQKAFADQRGLTMPLLSDFFPQGAVADAFGVRGSRGASDRAVFVVEVDGTISWAYKTDSPADMPPTDQLFEALAAQSA